VLTGVAFALGAGLPWGLVFIAPLLLPDYPALLLSFARYLAFGLIALPLAWWDRAALARLRRADWVEALKLSLVGNLLYYLGVAAAVQRAGGPLPTVVIGTLPVVIAVVANLGWVRSRWQSGGGRDGRSDPTSPGQPEAGHRLPWRRLAPPLLLIALGIGVVNHTELVALRAEPAADLHRYAFGALCALGAVVCWTWYPIRNGQWLRAHPQHSPRAWATAQGLATLPLSALGFALWWAWSEVAGFGFPMPLGPTPGLFLALMFAIGLFASWLGTLCWNEASQRLPTTLAGQLIVFETLAALAYAWALRGRWPDGFTLIGAALLVAGVVLALRRFARLTP
jgi:drug/metabolite transporter (DMT)-like permease